MAVLMLILAGSEAEDSAGWTEETGGEEESAAEDEFSAGFCREELAGGLVLAFGRDAAWFLRRGVRFFRLQGRGGIHSRRDDGGPGAFPAVVQSVTAGSGYTGDGNRRL